MQLNPARGWFGPFVALAGYRNMTPPAVCQLGLMRRAIMLANVGRLNNALFQGTSAAVADTGRTSQAPWRFRP